MSNPHKPTNRTVTTGKQNCTLAQSELLQYIENCGAQSLWYSLKFVHDTALYNSEIHITKDEKEDLFAVKELMDALEELAREDRGEI
jgi:hypothetical protein